MNARDPHALRQRLRLYWVMDGTDLDSAQGRARVVDALQSGVSCVQLRDKHSDTTQLIERAQILLRLARPWRVPVIVNDRVDVALAAGADGVHLGQSDTPVVQARAALGPYAVIGLSLEYPDQLVGADATAADYVAVSPVFDTPTSPTRRRPGRRGPASCAPGHPFTAGGEIGGIDAARLPPWPPAWTGAVVVRDSQATDTGAAATHLRSLMTDARPWRVPRVLSIAGWTRRRRRHSSRPQDAGRPGLPWHECGDRPDGTKQPRGPSHSRRAAGVSGPTNSVGARRHRRRRPEDRHAARRGHGGRGGRGLATTPTGHRARPGDGGHQRGRADHTTHGAAPA